MKKIIISILMLCALLVSMAGCALPENSTPTPPGGNPPSENPPSENPPAEQTVYEKLDSLAEKAYKRVSLSIVTNTSGIELCAEYIIPKAFDPRVGTTVAKAVYDAAVKSGVARIK